MTIEVRQMLIRSVIDESPGRPTPSPWAQAPGQGAAPELERLRAQLLAECKAWLAQQLREREER
jgi:hypothetical protein